MPSGLANMLNRETLESPPGTAGASPIAVKGPGGGLADLVNGTVGDEKGNTGNIALSGGEFVWPADVVSMLGDGDSEAGARILTRLMDEIRMKKQGGKKKQAAGIAEIMG